jgi:hypothetical protein
VSVVGWEYLQVTLFEEREAEGPPADFSSPGGGYSDVDFANTTYATIRRPDGKMDRVDLWVWLEKAKKHKAFHKTVVQLLCDLGADGWELVATHYTWARLYQDGHKPENQTFYFKRPKT